MSSSAASNPVRSGRAESLVDASAGRVVPGLALIARTQVTMQAKGLDQPLPPLDEWKAPPTGEAS